MSEISHQNELATFIVDFKVGSDKIQQLSEIAQQNIENVMSKKNGFVSANIHKSDDATRVINYVQWNSSDGMASVFNDGVENSYQSELKKISDSVWNIFNIVYST